MTTYAERLRPSFPVYLAVALVIPATFLVFMPLNIGLGLGLGLGLFAVLAFAMFAGSPVVRVNSGVLSAGAAKIGVEHLGEVTIFRGQEAVEQTRTRLDARAWIVLRGWIKPIVKIDVIDPHDPVPYWLVSTRSPEGLRDAIVGSQSEPNNKR